MEVFPLILFSQEREIGCLVLSPAGPTLIFFFKDENIWCSALEKLEKQISLELNIISNFENAN